jgi:hypothetical protein
MIINKEVNVKIELDEIYELENLKFVLQTFKDRMEAKLSRGVKLSESEDCAHGFCSDVLGGLV